MNKKLPKCPICGAYGEDLVFKFYCHNPDCQNFDAALKSGATDDITEALHDMWERYSNGETEDEFAIKFFVGGGKFSLEPDQHGNERIRVTEPQWLKDRKGCSTKSIKIDIDLSRL